jgi:hypothetical protein
MQTRRGDKATRLGSLVVLTPPVAARMLALSDGLASGSAEVAQWSSSWVDRGSWGDACSGTFISPPASG